MLALPLLLILATAPQRSAEITFVRHAETVANATGRYNSSTVDTLSREGLSQVAELTRTLGQTTFDAILVSPAPRALRTIAPYLRVHPGVKAEIWPELLECCDASSKRIKGPTSLQVRYGSKVKLPNDLAPYFELRPEDDRYILAPSYEDGLRQIELTVKHLQRRFVGSGERVLVVGHSIHGSRLIELLEKRPMQGKIRLENAKPVRLREMPGLGFIPEGRPQRLSLPRRGRP